MSNGRTLPLTARRLALCLVLALALPVPGSAATLLTNGYTMRTWQTDDGLPQNAVSSVLQTRDGFLWVATFGGLARFDGEHFETFDAGNTPAFADARIVSLFEDRDGTLWIGHETGAMTRYRHGRFEPVAAPPGGKQYNIRALGTDESGRMWVLRGNGALHSEADGGRVTTLFPPNDEPAVVAWARSDTGGIWIVENGVLARLVDGQLTRLDLPAPRLDNFAASVAVSARGGIWVPADHRLRRLVDGRWVEDRGDEWGHDSVSCCLELSDGSVAVGTVNRGLHILFGDGRPAVHIDQTSGLPQNWVRFAYEDREHNLWIGSGSAGLVALHPSAFSTVSPPDQWQGRTVLAVAPGRDGSLWMGTEGSGVYHRTRDGWTRYGAEAGPANPFIWCIREDDAGRVWAGSWAGGPYRLEGERFVRRDDVPLTGSPVLALLPDGKEGDILVGCRDGLMAVRRDRSEWLYRTPDGSPANVAALLRDPAGDLWFGLAQGGLGRLRAGKLTVFHVKDGLHTDSIRCLFAEADGALWIGTNAGLCRWREGRFATLSVAQGLASNVVSHIEDDGLGYLWLSTQRGLQRIAKEQLHRCADGALAAVSGHIFDRNDGLPTAEFSEGIQAAGARSSDGRLWFTSSKGLVAVDPTKMQHNPTAPPVVIETMVVDGAAHPLAASGAVEPLPPDHQRLEFRFAGLSFVAPSKVGFKYRLDGIDDNWVDAGSKRAAYYSRLPAGAYRFRVIACNNDGVWNTVGANVAFAVAPFFWQTWWFVGSAVLAVLSVVALAARAMTRRRMQRRLEQLERQHAIERERARIAQDIHDDIGTSLTRIAMFSQPEGSELEEPQQTAATLSRIYATTREATRALDEIVWAIDPRQDTLDGLVGYMGRFAQEMLDAAGIRCRLHLPVDLPSWPVTAEIRHNLFLAFKEALNNTVKHAGATEVRIALELRAHAFVLGVHDNGRGFDRRDPGPRTPGRIGSGRGLVHLERRLARIGGHCEIVSSPGDGTTVSFIVPVREETAASASSPGAS